MKKLALVIAVILVALLGGNYYLWSNEVKSINQSLVKIESDLAKQKVKLTYDSVDYGMMKAWDVGATLTNVKFEGGEGALKSEVSIQKVLLKKDNMNQIVEMKFDGDMVQKIATPMGEESYKFVFTNGIPTLKVSFDKTTNEIFKFEYSDSGHKMIDAKTGEQIVSVDSSMASASRIVTSDREKYELIIGTKNAVYTSIESKYPEFAGLFKDVPDLGGHDMSLNIMVDMPKANGQMHPIMLAMGSKVDLKELKYANKVFSFGIDGKYDGTTTPMPSGNINLVIGNYEKFIDILVGMAKGAKELKDVPMDPNMKASVDVKDEQVVKLKDWLKQFKTNDTDIKLDFVFGADGMSTLAGKPVESYMKDLDAIFMPPKKEVPGVQPPVVGPNGEVMPSPVVPAPAPMPAPEPMPQPAPMPQPQVQLPGQQVPQPAPIPVPMEPQASKPITQ